MSSMRLSCAPLRLAALKIAAAAYLVVSLKRDLQQIGRSERAFSLVKNRGTRLDGLSPASMGEGDLPRRLVISPLKASYGFTFRLSASHRYGWLAWRR